MMGKTHPPEWGLGGSPVQIRPPHLTQTARHATPGASRTLLAVLAACLTFGSWCAAQHLAAQLGRAAIVDRIVFTVP